MSENERQQFCGRTRRDFMWEAGGGFGAVALSGMLGDDFLSRQAVAADGDTPFDTLYSCRVPSTANRSVVAGNSAR